MSQENKNINSQSELAQKDEEIIGIYLLLNPDPDTSLLRRWRLDSANVDWDEVLSNMRLLIVDLLHDLESTVRDNEDLRQQIHYLKPD